MKKLNVLVVDDEERIINFLRSKLRVSGYEVLTASNGKEAFERFHNYDPDIIVLDLVMPEMDGFEFLKELRTFSQVPVIILSARSEDVDKIQGLNLGADDYLPKPFNPNELIARIEAISRRIGQEQKGKPVETLTLKDVHIDFKGHSLMVKGSEEHLTRIEWLLLAELVQNTGRVIAYEELLSRIWGPEYRNDIQILRTWISRLRNKLENNPDEPEYIVTVPKLGYMFKQKPA
ncbi:MAG: response regulator transcription factor [Dehalococcoidia bacterium]|jgi:two-component system KDP operon response regulator KdpE